MKTHLFIVGMLALMASVGFAQTTVATSDMAFIVTDRTSVDAAVAAAAAARFGAPVFVTDNAAVTSATIDAMTSAGVKTVVLVGGPAVIDEQIDAALEARGFAVVRVFGAERTGTALSLARFVSAEAKCVVLVDDTKSSEADTHRLFLASNFAARTGCVLIPIPAGDVPAEVLVFISEESMTQIHYVGQHEAAVRSAIGLSTVFRSEGELQQTLRAQTNATTKVVVVAAPSWRHAVAAAAHPQHHTVVIFATSANATADIAAFVKARNSTDIRVVGQPSLSGQIAAALRADNITVTQVSGEKAAAVAADIFAQVRTEVKARAEALRSERTLLRARVAERLRARQCDSHADQ